MIDITLVSAIISGCRLTIAAAQYLDSVNSKWRVEDIDSKLDIIRDVHLKAGYEFLKDAALSNVESNSNNSLLLAYSEFVKAKCSYSDCSEKMLKCVMGTANLSSFKVGTDNFIGNLWNKGVDKFIDSSDIQDKGTIAKSETENFIKSLEGLAFCHIIRGEHILAKDCLISIFQIRVKISWNIFDKMYHLLGSVFSPKIVSVIVGPLIMNANVIVNTVQSLDSSLDMEKIPYFKELKLMKQISKCEEPWKRLL